MTSPRSRRLVADAQRLHDAFTGHPAVRVEALGPAPAERYRVAYGVPGLRLTPDNHVARAHQHVVEVYLGAGYPREKPYVVSQTPVFHPNFGSHVCIADHWTPSQSLVDIVVQMGEMLQWQTFNTRSPLNAVAARWAAENTHQLPVGATSVQPLADVAVHLQALAVVVPAQPASGHDEPVPAVGPSTAIEAPSVAAEQAQPLVEPAPTCVLGETTVTPMAELQPELPFLRPTASGQPAPPSPLPVAVAQPEPLLLAFAPAASSAPQDLVPSSEQPADAHVPQQTPERLAPPLVAEDAPPPSAPPSPPSPPPVPDSRPAAINILPTF